MNQGLAADICIGWPGLEVRHWTNESRVSSRYMCRMAWSRGKALDGRPMNQGLAADICIEWPGLEVRHWTADQ